ncbi:MAG TPA: hypothetical protein VFI68_08430 [Anaerolineales bacterium]|nr:hypothetical protein [Anaerolineales bacterium]
MATQKKAQKRHTQAVVIIHGIGEQHPMETVRSFADALLPEPEQGGEKYFVRPDPLSESFELRRLQNRTQPRTQFFEYYWAYKVEGTKLGHLLSWLSLLLFRRPGKVPKQMLPLWGFSWLLIVITLTALGLDVFSPLKFLGSQLPPFIISIGSALLFSIFNLVFFLYIGDAARYLSPTPGNIKLRQSIRADGMQLLKKIHESGEYDRVVVVGHSLGSVIAYDILKHLWQDYFKEYRQPKASNQSALARLEKTGEDLRKGINGITLDDYMQAQIDLWKEMRSLGNPWLVTDFITAGCPLTHAAMLLANDEEDLRARQRQRDLPTNPPVPEVEQTKKEERRSYSYLVWEGYGNRQDIKLKAVHHGGLFAITRWTNLYYPALWGIFGDLVGGPLAHWFGPGIRDIPVGSGNVIRDRTLLAHTTYWINDRRRPSNPKLSISIEELMKALDIHNTGYFN